MLQSPSGASWRAEDLGLHQGLSFFQCPEGILWGAQLKYESDISTSCMGWVDQVQCAPDPQTGAGWGQRTPVITGWVGQAAAQLWGQMRRLSKPRYHLSETAQPSSPLQFLKGKAPGDSEVKNALPFSTHPPLGFCPLYPPAPQL